MSLLDRVKVTLRGVDLSEPGVHDVTIDNVGIDQALGSSKTISAQVASYDLMQKAIMQKALYGSAWPGIFDMFTGPEQPVLSALNAVAPGKVALTSINGVPFTGKWTYEQKPITYRFQIEVQCSMCGQVDTLTGKWNVEKHPIVEGAPAEWRDFVDAKGWRRLDGWGGVFADPLAAVKDIVVCSESCLHRLFNNMRDEQYPQRGV